MCLHPSPEHYFIVCARGRVALLDAHSLIYSWLNGAACVAVNNWQAIRKGWTTVAADSGTWTYTISTLITCVHTHRYGQMVRQTEANC